MDDVSQPRILLVDDEPDLRQMVRRYLQAEGFDVAEAANGETALQALKKSVPDMILLDIGMPGMDGFAVLKRSVKHQKSRSSCSRLGLKKSIG